MNPVIRRLNIFAVLGALFFLLGCEPEMGSQRWCDAMDKKDKGSWTLDEGKEYVNSCLFRSDS